MLFDQRVRQAGGDVRHAYARDRASNPRIFFQVKTAISRLGYTRNASLWSHKPRHRNKVCSIVAQYPSLSTVFDSNSIVYHVAMTLNIQSLPCMSIHCVLSSYCGSWYAKIVSLNLPSNLHSAHLQTMLVSHHTQLRPCINPPMTTAHHFNHDFEVGRSYTLVFSPCYQQRSNKQVQSTPSNQIAVNALVRSLTECPTRA